MSIVSHPARLFEEEALILSALYGKPMGALFGRVEPAISGAYGDSTIDAMMPGRQDVFNGYYAIPNQGDKQILKIGGPIKSSYSLDATGEVIRNKTPELEENKDSEAEGNGYINPAGGEYVNPPSGGYINPPQATAHGGAVGGILPAIIPIISALAPVVAPLLLKAFRWLIGKITGKKSGTGAEAIEGLNAFHEGRDKEDLRREFEQNLYKMLEAHKDEIEAAEKEAREVKGGSFISTLVSLTKSLVSKILPGIFGGAIQNGDEVARMLMKRIAGTTHLQHLPGVSKAKEILKTGSGPAVQLPFSVLKPLISHAVGKIMKQAVKGDSEDLQKAIRSVYNAIKADSVEPINGSGGISGKGWKEIKEWFRKKGQQIKEYITDSPRLAKVLDFLYEKGVSVIKSKTLIGVLAKGINAALVAFGKLPKLEEGEKPDKKGTLSEQAIRESMGAITKFIPDRIGLSDLHAEKVRTEEERIKKEAKDKEEKEAAEKEAKKEAERKQKEDERLADKKAKKDRLEREYQDKLAAKKKQEEDDEEDWRSGSGMKGTGFNDMVLSYLKAHPDYTFAQAYAEIEKTQKGKLSRVIDKMQPKPQYNTPGVAPFKGPTGRGSGESMADHMAYLRSLRGKKGSGATLKKKTSELTSTKTGGSWRVKVEKY